MAARIDLYSDEDFINIVKTSSSLTEVAKKLGYTSHSGSNGDRIRKRIDKLNISTDHFNLSNKRPKKWTEEEMFVENSEVCQRTLRDWYKKGEYTQYKCSICGQEPFWKGKELTLILDHINGHNHDDRLENLRWVCPNCNQQLDTTNGKNVKKMTAEGYKSPIITKKYYCEDCGKEITRNSRGKCQNCAILAQRTVIRPDREELKKLIREYPFTFIANQFGVSDNAIRKWCDAENLPRKKTEIVKMTDEEWQKI